MIWDNMQLTIIDQKQNISNIFSNKTGRYVIDIDVNNICLRLATEIPSSL